MIVSQTSQGEVIINPAGNNVGIKLSGGVDSAVLAYMIGLYKKKVRDINIVPITVIDSIKPWQDIYAKAIVSFIEDQLKIKFSEHVIPDEWVSPEDYSISVNTLMKSLYKTNVIDCHFAGITLNPPKDEVDIENLFIRDDERDPDGTIKPTVSPRGRSFTPLANINKRGVAELYRNYDLIDTLFPITRSCENRRVFHTEPHCGTGCWWCLERQWGFGRLK
jgi:hypothetical protein